MANETVGYDGFTEGTYDLGNVRVAHNPGSLEVSRRSKGPMGYFLIFFGGIWLLFTASLLASVLSEGPSGSIDSSGYFFSIPLLLLGLFMLYFGIISAFNRSIIRIENGRITKENKPLPWFGSRSYSSFDVNQIYVKTGMRENGFSRTTQFYDLHIRLKDGKEAILLSGIAHMKMPRDWRKWSRKPYTYATANGQRVHRIPNPNEFETILML